MADTNTFSVNVHECSWADLQCTLNVPGGKKIDIADFENIKWSRKLEVGDSRGIGGRLRKRTRGTPSCDASGTLSRGGWMLILEALEKASVQRGLMRGDKVAIGLIGFDFLLQHTPLGDSRIYQVRLSGCRWLGDSSDMKQGNEADMIESTLNPMEIATKSGSGNWLVLA